jgi:multidrug efflux pump
LSRSQYLASLLAVLFGLIKKEFAPREDRGSFTIQVTGPEGASVEYMTKHLLAVEKEGLKLVDSKEADRNFTVLSASSGNCLGAVNEGRISVGLKLGRTGARRGRSSGLTDAARQPGCARWPSTRPGSAGAPQPPFQMVISGNT